MLRIIPLLIEESFLSAGARLAQGGRGIGDKIKTMIGLAAVIAIHNQKLLDHSQPIWR
jgi:hypothetical protein